MVSANVNNFADGVPFIHLANVENIEAENFHEWGKKKYLSNLQFSEM